MLDSLKETLKGILSGPITDKYSFDESNTEGMIETILNLVKEKSGDLSEISESGIGASIMSALTTKNGLQDDVAFVIKDSVLPLIMAFSKNKLMDKIPVMRDKAVNNLERTF
jgi:hypothetical protein